MTTLSDAEQLGFSLDIELPEASQYLTKQILTYIGNKRTLLEPIGEAIEDVRRRSGATKLRTFDAFAGSGIVSRMLKRYSSCLTVNDIEAYAAATARCYLKNRDEVDVRALKEAAKEINSRATQKPIEDGFIRRLYAPGDEDAIKATDRVFYTIANAQRLDTMRTHLDELPASVSEMLLGPLLARASVHANTAGVFKGFYKNRSTGIGQFGGSGEDALSRIKAPITIDVPVLGDHCCDYIIHNQDANTLIDELGEFDLVYVDPPYNQHPYGSNYFMLNLLTTYREPTEVSAVSGIPIDWTRSGYNVRKKSLPLLEDFIRRVRSQFILISFNDEGYITPEEMREMMGAYGQFDEYQVKYNTFRGSRNLANRNMHVTEHLYLLEKK